MNSKSAVLSMEACCIPTNSPASAFVKPVDCERANSSSVILGAWMVGRTVPWPARTILGTCIASFGTHPARVLSRKK